MGEKRKRISIIELIQMAMSFSRKIKYDHVSSFAAHAALFLLLSLVPMIMFFISMFQYLPLDSGVMTEYTTRLIPDSLMPLLNTIVQEAYEGGTVAMRSFTMIVTLFCASKGVYAIVIGMNAVYGIRETRNVVILYAISILYVLIFFSVIGLMVVLIVFGNKLFEMLMHFMPSLAAFQSVFSIGKYLGMLVLVLLFFLALYQNVPNRRTKCRYELAGAMFSTVVWLVFSWAFSFYIDNYAHYSMTYGSLATIVIFILWMYGTMNIVFIGAEMNVVLRKYAEYGYNYKRAYLYFRDEYEGDKII